MPVRHVRRALHQADQPAAGAVRQRRRRAASPSASTSSPPRSYGMEATLELARCCDTCNFDGNITLQEHKYTEFESLVNNVPTSNPAIVGNELERQPNDPLQRRPLLRRRSLRCVDLHQLHRRQVRRVEQRDRARRLQHREPRCGLHVRFGRTSAVRLGINVFNLLDTDATTEGRRARTTARPRAARTSSAGRCCPASRLAVSGCSLPLLSRLGRAEETPPIASAYCLPTGTRDDDARQ